ncbi:uncharacterized protein ACMZJ9_021117 [Mantella aurantiaca]
MDLYKDIKMESITSPDGSSNRNPPERCPRPLYSRDSTQEDLTIPHHHQVYGNPPERCPRPLYSRDSTQEDLTIPHHHQDEELKEMKVEVKKEEEETLMDTLLGTGKPLREILFYLQIIIQKIMTSHNILQKKSHFLIIYITDLTNWRDQWIPLILRNLLILHILLLQKYI